MTAKKVEEKEDKDDAGDEEVDADKADSPGHSDNDSLDQRIRDLVREAVESLTSGFKSSDRKVDDEEHLFNLVKKAQEKIKADEEREGRFKTVEETVQKLVEKPPARDGIGGKIQRWMWGGE